MYTKDRSELGRSGNHTPVPELKTVEVDITAVKEQNDKSVNKLMTTLNRFWQDSVVR